jgi:hypothetical protein
MKNQARILLPPVALFFMILWASCSKSHSSNNSTASLITQSSWRYDTSGIDLNKDGIVDIGGDTLIAPCEKDDIYTFRSDSTGTIDEGAAKCHVSDPQTDPFTWSLTNNQTVLTVASTAFLSGNINIFSTTSSKWILYKDTTVSGISVRYLVSLKH